jgi:NAD(P)-dependent dehydrogenase (short-subunit alcohol dehydrogenase family)
VVELLEVNLVNQVAPFILNSRLKALLERSEPGPRFIINVTSSEGRFSYRHKTVFHPHTNMAKAALNMMTGISAKDYADSGIYIYE